MRGQAKDGSSIEFRIFETEQFQKDMRKIDRSGHARVHEKLRRFVYPHLMRYPHFGANIKKLKGYSPPTWRYRIGPWRFFYCVDDDRRVVYMIAACHRSSAY